MRLQKIALLIALIAIVLVVLSPGLDDPVLIVKNHQAHVTGGAPSAIIGLSVTASQQTRLQLFAIVAHRYRFSSPHNHNLIELTCTRLC